MKSSPPSTGSPWFQKLRRVEHLIFSFEKAICGISLFIMLAATASTVFSRNLQLSTPNYGELGLAALIPLTLIGGAMCTCLGSHISVEVMQTLPSRRVKHALQLLTAAATIVFALFYAYSGSILVEEFILTGDKLLDLGTPYWALASFFPIGMGLMIFHSTMQILSIITGHPAGANTEFI
jgi:TRAP-type C4-dicarboxylate transport system permease small subunit